jgi:hypothetical protein
MFLAVTKYDLSAARHTVTKYSLHFHMPHTSFNIIMPPLSEPSFACAQSPPSSSHSRRRVSKGLSALTNLSLSVTFGEEVKVSYVEPNAGELSPEEIEDTWYNAGQFKMIKSITLVLVKMMRKGKVDETDEYSFRGLEHRTKKGSEARRDAKERAVDVLFLEVQRQKVKGIADPENLAKLLNECNAERQQVALQLAKLDQEAVLTGSTSFTTEETDSQEDTASIFSLATVSIASASTVEEESSSSIASSSDEGSLDFLSPKGRRRSSVRASRGTALRRRMSPHGLRNFLRRPKADQVAVIVKSSFTTEETDTSQQGDMTSVSSQAAVSIASAPVEEESSSIAFEGELLPLESSDEGSLDPLSLKKGRRRGSSVRASRGGKQLPHSMSPHGLRNLLIRPNADQEAVIGSSSLKEEIEEDSQDMTSVSLLQEEEDMSVPSAAPVEEESSSIAFAGDELLPALEESSDEGSLDPLSPKGRRRSSVRAPSCDKKQLQRSMSPHGLKNLLRGRPKRDPVTGKRETRV